MNFNGLQTDDKSGVALLTGAYVRWTIPEGWNRIEVDLGCGSGSFLLQMAEANPETLFLGVDIMLGRLRKVQKKIERLGLQNVILLRAPAWSFIDIFLPSESVDRIHILCPDPWPKAKHRGNRLASSEFMGCLSQKIKRCGTFHFGSDHVPYVEMVLSGIAGLRQFVSNQNRLEDHKEFKTDFEKGFLEEGKLVHHFAWELV